VAVADEKKGMVLARFTGWRGFELVVWEDLASSIEAVLAVVGAANPRARVVSLGPDRSAADIEARFG
jgi:hypothetical protein